MKNSYFHQSGDSRCSVQRGIALLLVLWVLALLTIIAVGLTMTQRTESSLAGNQLATARFQALAEAGVSWAALNLLAPLTIFDQETEPWVPDGEPRSWTFAGATLQIRVFNEASRIDLNQVPRDLLEALLRAAALEADEASALADAIEDWRDPDDLPSLNGAEDREYAAAGRPYGTKDNPFDLVDELQLVLGVDQDLYRTLFPALTVNSGGAELNQQFSPPLVQAALESLGRGVPARDDNSDAHTVDRGGPIYRVRVTQVVDKTPGLSMEALVRIEAGRSPPFGVLRRRFGLAAE